MYDPQTDFQTTNRERPKKETVGDSHASPTVICQPTFRTPFTMSGSW